MIFPDPSIILPNDIVQVTPECPNKCFRGMLVIVTEQREWGVCGYVQTFDGNAHVRLRNGEFVYVGRLEFAEEGP